MSPAASVPVTSTEKVASDFTRPSSKFRPSIWGDLFQYDSESLEVNDSVKQQIQAYKEEVKKMFLSSSNNISQKLKFIDSVQLLGISYHFEHEINEALEQIHNAFTTNNLTTEDGDLRYLALLFRLLRQQGYHISSDIFNKFKNNKGKFNDIIAQDVLGMWSLYEAAQLRVHGEDILDEALDFTYTNLKSMANQLSPSLAAQINQSLRQPLHKEFPRIEARHYMSFYEEDPSHDKVLLTFAKLDFNRLQKLHQKEVGSNAKWWKKSDFVTKVPHTRDRVVESYFCAFMSHEPKHSTSRRIASKLVLCTCLMDDTYDAYGTVEELELFTEAIKRWDISLTESLPECMKVVFNAVVEVWDEIELLISEGGNSSLVPLFQHVKQACCDLAHGYMVEAKWRHEGYIPTYDEYKANGIVSSTVPQLIRTFIYLGEFASKEVLDWAISDPIINAASLHGRLKNDMSSHKFEQQRVHVASAVECCMKQYGISQEEAYKLIHKETEDNWKDINEACLKLDDVPKPVLDLIANFARIIELLYENFEDRYTDGELLKDFVAKVLLDPIII